MGFNMYWIPIRTALILFPILAMLLILPWLIYTYRKYGFLSLWTSFVVYSFIFYGLCMFFLVILPLPESRNNWQGHDADTVYQVLVPFTFVKDILKSEDTRAQLLQNLAFLQALFNVFLFFPLGVYLKYFRLNWRKVILIGFLISLFFEITQRTGLYGIYRYPYRLFDVDDLILNTFGAWLGYVVAPLLLALFPSAKDVERKAEQVMQEPQVRPFARLLALMIDLSLIGFFRIGDREWVLALGYAFIFLACPLLFQGKTPGTAILTFRLRSKKWYGIALRALILYATHLIYKGLSFFSDIPVFFESELYYYQLAMTLMAFLGAVLLTGILMVHCIRVLMYKHIDEFYFDKLGGVQNTREKPIDKETV